MQVLREDIQLIERWFQTPDLIGWWPDIQRHYQMLGFTDVLTDAERIQEYKYITEQLRKYIFSKQSLIMQNVDDLNLMLVTVEQLISKAKESTDSRKQLVYSAMRDEWLRALYNDIYSIIEEASTEE